MNVELFRSLFVFGIRVRGRGRVCRSSSFLFKIPAGLLANTADTTRRPFRKSKTTLDRAPMVHEHEHLRLTLSLAGKLKRT